MLNYLWAGMIILSLLFALGHDTADLLRNRYGNERTLPVEIVEDGQEIAVRVMPEDYAAMFGVPPPDEPLVLKATPEQDGTLQLAGDLPEPLATMATHADPDESVLMATPTSDRAGLTFVPVRFVKMVAIQRAAFSMAEFAVELAIGLIGLMALWLGLVKIGEAAGMIHLLVRLVRPVLGWIFPQLPRDHPALGLIALNLTANALGLGNAATPLGIKAMQSLQELNPTEDTATNPMVMLLAMNTASVTLVPPVSVVAIMGLEAGRLALPIIAVTAMSLLIAILATKLLGSLRGYRQSDPNAVAGKEVA